MFKVGDLVLFVKESHSRTTNGDIFKIIEITNDDWTHDICYILSNVRTNQTLTAIAFNGSPSIMKIKDSAIRYASPLELAEYRIKNV